MGESTLTDSGSGSKCSIKAKQVEGGQKPVGVVANPPGIHGGERLTRLVISYIVNRNISDKKGHKLELKTDGSENDALNNSQVTRTGSQEVWRGRVNAD